MPLKPYQAAILPNTLYEIQASGLGAEQGGQSIEVIGGAVNIYGAQTLPAVPPTGMFGTRFNFTGIDYFGIVPNYLYVQGSPTAITLTGITAKQVV